MTKYWNKPIKKEWIKDRITNSHPDGTIPWAKEFGTYLARKGDKAFEDKNLTKPKFRNNRDVKRKELTTNQLRKFFGEVKRLQTFKDFPEEEFAMLKPKLAYAVARVGDEDAKINDFYDVLQEGIDLVNNKTEFKNFIKIFEAIVAYHKAAEESKLELSNKNH